MRRKAGGYDRGSKERDRSGEGKSLNVNERVPELVLGPIRMEND